MIKKSKSSTPSSASIASIFQAERATELLALLLEKYPQKKKKIKAVLKAGQVSVNGYPIRQYNHPVAPHDQIQIQWEHTVTDILTAAKLTLIHEDRLLIAVNKPAGLLTVGTEQESHDTAYRYVNLYLQEKGMSEKAFILHRLDRDTSGVLVFAKNIQMREKIQKDWTNLVKERVYYGIIEGHMKSKSGQLEHWIYEDSRKVMQVTSNPQMGKKVNMTYQVCHESDHYSLVQFLLLTGRKNQIRVQMKAEGHPILGDKKYGSSYNPLNRMALHCEKLSMRLPEQESYLTFKAAVPREFYQLVGMSQPSDR